MARIISPVWLEKYKRWQLNQQKDGVRRTFTSYTPGEKGARECAKKADLWLNDGVVGTSRVDALCDTWIEELKVTTSRSHWSQYEYFCRCYVKPSMGARKWERVTEQDLQNIIIYAFKHPASGKPLSKKTLKDLAACVKALTKRARKAKLTRLIPEDIVIPKDAKESERSTLMPEDLKKLFSSDKTYFKSRERKEWYTNAFRFECVMGLRPGEICALEHKNIVGNTCRISGSINIYGEHTKGKNKRAQRSIVIPPIGLLILEAQKRQLREAGIISPYVFPAPDGDHFLEGNYYVRWVKYRDYNGMQKKRPYELRHTFIAVNKEIPAELVKAIAGHGEDFDTFGVYGGTLAGEAEKTAKMVDDNFKKWL